MGKVIVLVVIAAVAIVLAITVLGYVGPFVAVLGVLLAAVVMINPGGVGSSLRQSMAWWSIPGMRRASSRAAPFAALLLLYTVPVPVGAFALVHGANHGSPSSPSGPALAVGGGPTSTAISTPATLPPSASTTAPTVAPTAPPTRPPTVPPTARATTPPTARPTPTPHPNLCGAPPNPWNYNFCGGGTIAAPPSNFCSYFACIKSFWQSTNGYVEECSDGKYSHSGGVRGSCSRNGGNFRPLNP